MTLEKLQEIVNQIDESRENIKITPSIGLSLVIFVCFFSLACCVMILSRFL